MRNCADQMSLSPLHLAAANGHGWAVEALHAGFHAFKSRLEACRLYQRIKHWTVNRSWKKSNSRCTT